MRFLSVSLSEITLGNRNRWLLRLDRISFSESISVNLMNLSLWRNSVLQFYSYNRHLMISLSAITFRDSKRCLSSFERIRFSESVLKVTEIFIRISTPTTGLMISFSLGIVKDLLSKVRIS